MSTIAKPVTAFTFADTLEPQHFKNLQPAEAMALETARRTGNLIPFLQFIVTRLMSRFPQVQLSGVYGIVHNQDRRKTWDMAATGYVDVPKPRHVHILCVVAGGRNGGLLLSQVADALGYEEHMLEKPKRGRFAIDNLLAYLIHAKDADKHLYEPTKVFTLLGKSYVDIYCEQKDAWEHGRAKKTRQRAKLEVDVIVEKARTGEIFKEQLLLDDDLYEVYSQPANRRLIDSALEVYSERRMAQLASGLRQHLFSTLTIFVSGPAGSGKSILAEGVAEFLCKELGWRYGKLAARNAMDDYEGQEIVLMDDVRGGAMDVETWLGFLDPHHESTSAARYRNKQHVAARLIIITSNDNPFCLFAQAKRVGSRHVDGSADLDTFTRRIGGYFAFQDSFDTGPYNVTLMVPRKGDPYRICMTSDRDAYNAIDHEFVDRIRDYTLRWRFENFYENGDRLTLYGAIVADTDVEQCLAHGGNADTS